MIAAHALPQQKRAADVLGKLVDEARERSSRAVTEMDLTLPTCLAGILAVTVPVAGALTAAIAYRGRQGEAYSVLDRYISDLGEVGVSRYAELFNTSLMLGGLALAIFMLGMGRLLGVRWGYAAACVGVYSGLSCTMVGAMPINMNTHSAAAFSYFTSVLTAITFFSLAILRDRRGRLSRWLLVPGALTMIGFALFASQPRLVPPVEVVACATTMAWIGLTATNLALRGRLYRAAASAV